MSMCTTTMSYSPTPQLSPWNSGMRWNSGYISSALNIALRQRQAHSSEPHSPNNEEVNVLDETKKGLLGAQDGTMVPTQRSPALSSQNFPNTAIFNRPRSQADEDVPRNIIPDDNLDFATGNESTQVKEQTQTMLGPEPNYVLRPLLGSHTPPRSTSSFPVIHSKNVYEDVFTSPPISPMLSDAPPNYPLINPHIMPKTPENLNTTRLNTTFLNANPNMTFLNPNGTISSAPTSLFNTQWAQIQKRRIHNMGLRSQIRDMRRRLREKQNAKSATEDQFFQRVRKKEMRGQGGAEQEDELMIHLMNEYQAARDQYGPMEDDCNQMEDRLDADEFALHQLENEFYQRWTVVPDTTSPKPPSSPQADVPPTPETDTFEDDDDFSYHPLVEKFLSKQGDLDLLIERQDEIYDERENLEEQRETRAALGLPLGDEEEDWLENSENMLAEVDIKIEAMEAEVANLKKECIAQGLVDLDGEPIDMLAKEMNAFPNEQGLDAKSEVSEYSKYPKILQQPLVKEDEGSDYIVDLGEKSYTLGARINKWMLDRLRSSALEVNLLARTYEKEGKGKETSDVWQISVLKLWYEDGTVGFEARTSTIRSGSGRSDTRMNASEWVERVEPVRNSLVRIHIASSLPVQEKVEAEEGREEAGRLVRPSRVMTGFSSHSH